MSWKTLQSEGKARAHKASKKELDELRGVIARDLEDAAIQELSDDRRFATAYNAALQASKMAILCAGYQLASTPGHHRLTFEAAAQAQRDRLRPRLRGNSYRGSRDCRGNEGLLRAGPP